MARKYQYYSAKKRTVLQRSHARTQKRDHPAPEKAPLSRLRAKEIVLFCFFVASMGWFVYFFVFSKHAQVRQVRINGIETIPEKEIYDIVASVLNSTQLFVVPNKNMLFLPKTQLARAIGDAYLLDAVSIDRVFPYTIHIDIHEKLARVLLRAKRPIVITDPITATSTATSSPSILPQEAEPVYITDMFLLDVNGIVVQHMEASDENATSTYPIIEVVVENQTDINPGVQFLNRETIETLFSVNGALRASSAHIEPVYIKFNMNVPLELTFVTAEGWEGILNMNIALDTQIKKLELALEEKIGSDRARLQYVDLRVKDRVYYK